MLFMRLRLFQTCIINKSNEDIQTCLLSTLSSFEHILLFLQKVLNLRNKWSSLCDIMKLICVVVFHSIYLCLYIKLLFYHKTNKCNFPSFHQYSVFTACCKFNIYLINLNIAWKFLSRLTQIFVEIYLTCNLNLNRLSLKLNKKRVFEIKKKLVKSFSWIIKIWVPINLSYKSPC